MSTKKLSLFILLTICSLTLFAQKPYVINVRNQNEFNNITTSIKEALKQTTNVKVNIFEGLYTFGTGHLKLSNIKNKNVEIEIVGHNATIIGGLGTNTNSPYNYVYFNDKYEKIDSWSSTIQLKKKVEIVDKKKKVCRIYLPNIEKSSKSIPNYILLTEWYNSKVYTVSRISGNYLYFVADDLQYISKRGEYNVNYDYAYGRKYPRCRLFLGAPKSYKYKCGNGQFLSMGESQIKTLSISGIDFIGNGGASVLLMASKNQLESLTVQNCSFKNINGEILYAVKTDNVSFNNNIVENCNKAVVVSESDSKNTKVLNNRISNIGQTINNVKVLHCISENFIIKNNIISDFSYAAIASGLHYTSKSSYKSSGTIEDNELFYTPEYFRNVDSYTLMDGGAIYISTKTDGIVIENNYIHDISGVLSNRGIFCDDGTKNVSIIGNVIQRVANSYCIDLRNCSYVKDFVSDHNTCNNISENVVDGKIRFEKKGNKCIERNNISFNDKNIINNKSYKYWRNNIK